VVGTVSAVEHCWYDCRDEMPHDENDLGAYPGPDPDCNCDCHFAVLTLDVKDGLL
jgi:hypothetical protein